MFQIRLVNGKQSTLYQATHIVENFTQEDQGKFQLELGPPARLDITLPDDGQVIYVMNDKGKTIGTYRAPTQERKAAQ